MGEVGQLFQKNCQMPLKATKDTVAGIEFVSLVALRSVGGPGISGSVCDDNEKEQVPESRK